MFDEEYSSSEDKESEEESEEEQVEAINDLIMGGRAKRNRLRDILDNERTEKNKSYYHKKIETFNVRPTLF